jgi:ribose-phosphate pyrophosphokinase
MRQDKAFTEGEAVSQSVIGNFLAELFDDVITVDPHLHRVHRFADAVPASHAESLSATELMRQFLHDQPDVILLGPDSESEQWVSSIAETDGLVYGVASKQRLGDREVRIKLPGLDLAGKQIVLVDDVISTGETIAMTAQACYEYGATSVNVLVTHALFASGAVERLRQAGVDNIWSTDSIPHQSNCIILAEVLASAVRGIV